MTLNYDDLDRLTSEITPQGTVSYTYDAAGRRKTMTVAGQPQVTYTYDNANQLRTITQASAVVTLDYDEAGRRTSMTLPNGIRAFYGYDAASQLRSLTYKQGATVIGDLTYDYDNAGNRTKVGGSWARTGLPQPVTSATYDQANRTRTFDAATLSYDDNGNLTSATDSFGTATYIWDSRNRLAGLTAPGLMAGFTYDALGRRITKTVSGLTTNYLFDGLNPVQELAGASPRANLLTGLGVDEYFTRTDAAGSRTLQTDALGSTLALTDNNGTIQTSYTYEPFGNTTIAGTASANSFQYTGRENDVFGLYYYRARYYSPRMQRFISEDPIGFKGGVNFYGYASNNPSTLIDPLGLFPNCGSGKQTYVIPDFVFTDACKKHDDCYGACGATKSSCDSNFLTDMLAACKKVSTLGTKDCYSSALLYYGSVVSGGGGAYRDSQAQCKGKCKPGDLSLGLGNFGGLTNYNYY